MAFNAYRPTLYRSSDNRALHLATASERSDAAAQFNPALHPVIATTAHGAERLFNFPDIGALSEADAAKALRDPAQEAGVEFQEDALQEVFRLTHGYPYFIQEWGYQAWNIATASPITLQTAQAATPEVTRRLDKNFFRVRFDRLTVHGAHAAPAHENKRLNHERFPPTSNSPPHAEEEDAERLWRVFTVTPGEKNFLRAMAHLGPGYQRTGDIATTLGMSVKGIGPMRSKLIKKGMIYSPAHGDMAFTVPLFDEFMIRAMPEFTPG